MSNKPKTKEEFINEQLATAKAAAEAAWGEQEKANKLLTAHESAGYANARAYVEALVKAHGLRGFNGGAAPKTNGEAKGKRPRVTITDQIKKDVIKLLKADESAVSIAAATGISPASVNTIKKEAGLTTPRKKKN